MDVIRSRSSRWISNAPGKLYRALPSVALGIMFNVLDSVSTGLLLFPSDGGAFQSVQLQALSMFIMSTITSQIAITLGGSRFPGAIGAMLIEILPFLRGVATDIRNALGDDSPALIPTVMAAYALTSFLTGASFIILGLLKLGNLVAYFPQTVLTGAIGAIGLSLFILALGLTLPSSSPDLSLGNARSVLFNDTHLPLLAASFIPALFLSFSIRSQSLKRWTRGMVQSDYYIPTYLFCIPIFFWIVAGATHVSKDSLVDSGWLFQVAASESQPGTGIGDTWNYWKDFNFSLVEWRAMKNALANIVLVVVIGVLNLPIYVPALAFSLDVSYDMNHEFFGQGAANLLAGLTGTVPNILQYSYSVFFTRAHGGRFEAAIVTILTFVLFVTSGLLLPYVPTILASSLVLFLGLELMAIAVWESARTLVLLEYSIVLATLLACTFLGFAQGFGVGIGASTVVYLAYGVVDSRARAVQWEEWNETHRKSLEQRRQSGEHELDSLNSSSTALRALPFNLTPSAAILALEANHSSSTGIRVDVESARSTAPNTNDVMLRINARIIALTGYVFFATIPSLEMEILNGLNGPQRPRFVILDLSTVYRLETAAAQAFDRARRDFYPSILVCAGLTGRSGAYADFQRAGVEIRFFELSGTGSATKTAATTEDVKEGEREILAFRTCKHALLWCQRRYEHDAVQSHTGSDKKGLTDEEVYDLFCTQTKFEPREVFATENVSDIEEPIPTSTLTQFMALGGRIQNYHSGQLIVQNPQRIVFIVDGEVEIITAATHSSLSTDASASRPSLTNFLMMMPRESLAYVRERANSLWTASRTQQNVTSSARVGAGEILDFIQRDESFVQDKTMRIVRARSRCYAVEIGMEGSESLRTWAMDNAVINKT